MQVDAALSREPLRYHTHNLLLAHAPVLQPAAAAAHAGLDAGLTAASLTSSASDASDVGASDGSVDVGPRQCFDGLDHHRLGRLAAGYLSSSSEAEVAGFSERRATDRTTFHVGANVSSGGCNVLPTPELWLRVQCAAGNGGVRSRLYECRVRVTARLYLLSVPVGYDQTLRLPLEPGAADAASRLLFKVDLGESDILRLTLHSTPITCTGQLDHVAEPFPDNATAAFGGYLVAQLGGCPSVASGSGLGYLANSLHSLPADAPGNASLEFFCSDHPGE